MRSLIDVRSAAVPLSRRARCRVVSLISYPFEEFSGHPHRSGLLGGVRGHLGLHRDDIGVAGGVDSSLPRLLFFRAQMAGRVLIKPRFETLEGLPPRSGLFP